ncbi:hypothetical protein RND81_07G140400 [Saponaria officinalis]|uniref:B30.2/SPRY domain-containing protein n=1 Tax=Saponaria officinalis TaxID=3572 RepID=A0AAW1JN87_SAPOF
MKADFGSEAKMIIIGLAFNIESDGLTGHALYEQGFAYCWSGARGTVGITGGKYYFGCRVLSRQPVEMEDIPLDEQNVCRIGISRGDDPVGTLGETDHSYGFGGTGKFSNAGIFVDYGEKFGVGDTVICLVDLESEPWGSIEFCKNGRRLGIAKKLDTSARKLTWASAVFPHILLKNTVVEMQFSVEDGLIPVEGYAPWASAMKDGKAIPGPSLAGPTDCEVIMMVGLPASGKSTWVEKWVKEHPEKRYVLLGTNLALDQMKVNGLLQKNNYGERFDRLTDQATGIFNTLLSRASKVPRNYIIDQTNVYKSARKRKLKAFAFYHKIAVVVFPRADVLKLRVEKRYKEMGNDVPPEALIQMLANFVLPMTKDMRGTDEYFDQVIFTDLNRDEAQQHLDKRKMKCALASSLTSEIASTSGVKSVGVHPAYFTETFGGSDFGFSIYSVPDPEHSHPRISVTPARVAEGCSLVGRPTPYVPTYSANTCDGNHTTASSYPRISYPVQAKEAYQVSFTTPDILDRRNDFSRYKRHPLITQSHRPPARFKCHQSSCEPSYASHCRPATYGYQPPSSHIGPCPHVRSSPFAPPVIMLSPDVGGSPQ